MVALDPFGLPPNPSTAPAATAPGSVQGEYHDDPGPELVQLLTPEGERIEHPTYSSDLDDEAICGLYRDMALTRRFDAEATSLQRQGELGIWASCLGQEAAQVGSGRALAEQDYVFPTYREHGVAWCRDVDPMHIISMFRGVDYGGYDPTRHRFAPYAIVIGAQTLHAVGYAMGMQRDGTVGDPDTGTAVLGYFGDGATSQGDVSEAFVFAASYRTPQVFFLQNNHWAISVPVERQSRTPLYLRPAGFGIPSVQIDGNDVLASYAVTTAGLDAARSGEGPRFIEALTYRMGAHTTSDDPTKYREDDDVTFWSERDPITRYEAYLRSLGEGEDFFQEVATEAEDLAADVRRRTVEIGTPPATNVFRSVYTDPHPLVEEQAAWFAAYEAGFEGGAA